MISLDVREAVTVLHGKQTPIRDISRILKELHDEDKIYSTRSKVKVLELLK